jgi:hypothetical protein
MLCYVRGKNNHACEITYLHLLVEIKMFCCDTHGVKIFKTKKSISLQTSKSIQAARLCKFLQTLFKETAKIKYDKYFVVYCIRDNEYLGSIKRTNFLYYFRDL